MMAGLEAPTVTVTLAVTVWPPWPVAVRLYVVVVVGDTVAVPAALRPEPTPEMVTEVALVTFEARMGHCPGAGWLGVAEKGTTGRARWVVPEVVAVPVRPSP